MYHIQPFHLLHVYFSNTEILINCPCLQYFNHMMLKFKLIGPSQIYLDGIGNPFHQPHPNVVMSREAIELFISHVFRAYGL